MELTPLRGLGTSIAAIGAVVSFQLAYASSALALLMVAYLGSLMLLTRAATNRRAFYTGLAVGSGVFVPQMGFLWTIFGFTAIPLWLALAFWHGLFVLLGRQCWIRLGQVRALLLLPFLWTGLEYFRSELYFLRFSWFNAGYAFWEWPSAIGAFGGVYGVGFWLMDLIGFAFPDLPPKELIRFKSYVNLTQQAGAFIGMLTYATVAERWWGIDPQPVVRGRFDSIDFLRT